MLFMSEKTNLITFQSEWVHRFSVLRCNGFVFMLVQLAKWHSKNFVQGNRLLPLDTLWK